MVWETRSAAVQKNAKTLEYTQITTTAPIATKRHGGRAKCLQRLVRLDMPIPRTLALSFDAVAGIAVGILPDTTAMMRDFGDGTLVSVRPSSEDPDWGGPRAVLNIGMNDARHAQMELSVGKASANALYLRFIQAYAVHVARLDADMFEDQPFDKNDPDGDSALQSALRAYEDETDEKFPQDPAQQLAEVLRSMARAWSGTTARLLRSAKGAPEDAGLGLVVQEMALGVGHDNSGSGVIQFVDSETGLPQITGRYKCQSQGRDALGGQRDALFLNKDPRGDSLQDMLPEQFDRLVELGGMARRSLREEMQIEFTIEGGVLHILDAVRVNRRARAALRIAVDLARDDVIAREEAIMRINPHSLTELLHPHVDPLAERDILARGIGASPGAALGRIVFSATAAQAAAAKGDAVILVRRETSPEDIRGMHASVAVVTEKGGMTSHAAVIARGLGLPCIVGAFDLVINSKDKTLTTPNNRRFVEGDLLTVDGSLGEVLAGEPKLLDAALDDAFTTLLDWADDARDIDVRANADTPADAKTARRFAAQGIGLCRTEHMFFEDDRLTVMREMIFANGPEDRRAALDRLMPMQRADFIELFEIMKGQSVCIRLFDPPLHEFLPSTREGIHELAEALDLPLSTVTARIEALTEFNPMLGMRGVRLGITIPEIYDMQARAIFEAAVEVTRRGDTVVPEIMIPLVSAQKEAELVKSRIDSVAAAVRFTEGVDFTFRLGVMVETPRAALRAGDIALNTDFLSFGTNDLTQMTYGLSRDDAARFMFDYVRLGVYTEDPFHVLDTDGVGELLTIGAERGRAARPQIVLGICGEHGGNPESIAFCRRAGFDYVSCSPYRVPVARLAAAQLAIAGKWRS
ncbi:pyruvate, phosphate dikinase [Falsihalocynthiibacter sp. S25ZX9]|uniref:pyruvate, phosphate dikinase n=1 Tax=Falsihalocynthiibacter sp. S25ZX9 TaxID=3240870 RepID=UPI00350F89CE